MCVELCCDWLKDMKILVHGILHWKLCVHFALKEQNWQVSWLKVNFKGSFFTSEKKIKTLASSFCKTKCDFNWSNQNEDAFDSLGYEERRVSEKERNDTYMYSALNWFWFVFLNVNVHNFIYLKFIFTFNTYIIMKFE